MRSIIITNVRVAQVTHITRCKTSHQMWKNLEDFHESKGHTTAITINQNLFHTIAEEGSNIPEHLTKMKEYFKCINMISNEDILITDCFFKVILISSLPPSWDTFTNPYLGGVVKTDRKKLMSSKELISILKEEYLGRQVCTVHTDSVNLATQQKPSLAKHMGMENDQSSLHTKSSGQRPRRPCAHCRKDNHITNKCKLLGKLKCTVCHKFSHMVKDCWDRPGKKRGENDNASVLTNNGTKQKIEVTHVVAIEGVRIEEVEEEIVFNTEENLQLVGDNDEDEIVTTCIGIGDNESILWY